MCFKNFDEYPVDMALAQFDGRVFNRTALFMKQRINRRMFIDLFKP